MCSWSVPTFWASASGCITTLLLRKSAPSPVTYHRVARHIATSIHWLCLAFCPSPSLRGDGSAEAQNPISCHAVWLRPFEPRQSAHSTCTNGLAAGKRSTSAEMRKVSARDLPDFPRAQTPPRNMFRLVDPISRVPGQGRDDDGGKGRYQEATRYSDCTPPPHFPPCNACLRVHAGGTHLPETCLNRDYFTSATRRKPSHTTDMRAS